MDTPCGFKVTRVGKHWCIKCAGVGTTAGGLSHGGGGAAYAAGAQSSSFFSPPGAAGYGGPLGAAAVGYTVSGQGGYPNSSSSGSSMMAVAAPLPTEFNAGGEEAAFVLPSLPWDLASLPSIGTTVVYGQKEAPAAPAFQQSGTYTQMMAAALQQPSALPSLQQQQQQPTWAAAAALQQQQQQQAQLLAVQQQQQLLAQQSALHQAQIAQSGVANPFGPQAAAAAAPKVRPCVPPTALFPG